MWSAFKSYFVQTKSTILEIMFFDIQNLTNLTVPIFTLTCQKLIDILTNNKQAEQYGTIRSIKIFGLSLRQETHNRQIMYFHSRTKQFFVSENIKIHGSFAAVR